MRPPSIMMFERLFLASLALSLLGFVLNYGQISDVATSDPGMAQLGLGMGFLIGVMVASYALYVLFWFLIARRASNVAKWILVVFTVLGVLSMLPTLTGSLDATALLSLAVYALEIAAVVYLFRPDAKDWLAGKGQADPTTFD